MNFQVNYSPSVPASAAVDVPLYASVDGIAHALGQGECAFQPRGTDQTHVMTTQVLEALDATRAFRTLDEHASLVSQRIAALRGQFDAVKRVLSGLAERGLLISDSQFLDHLRSVAPRTPAPFAGIFIRACDRPAQLSNLFDSAVEGERGAAVKRRYVVLDDSRDSGNRRGNAEAARRFADASGARVEIVDAPRWAALVERLAKAVPTATGAIRHALAREDAAGARVGGGKGYNLASLLAAGSRFALLDEDFVLPLRAQAGARDGVDLVAQEELPARLYDDVDAALSDGVVAPGDAFESQLAWCGQSMGTLLATDPRLAVSREDLRGIAPSRHPQLALRTHIIATANGHRGSSGSSVPHWLFLLDGASRAQLWQGREQYLRQIESANVWIGPQRARLQPQGNFTPFLVDGEQLLPPTLPVGRSEDLLFGILCHALHPRSAVLHTPWSIGHKQEAVRSATRKLFEPDTPGLNQYIGDWVGGRLRELRAETPAARMATLAAWIEDLAAAPRSVRIELLHEYLRFNRADLIERLQHAFGAAPDAPIYWQADVRELITVNAKALTQASAPRLAGWPTELDAAGCADRLADELAGFAQVLAHWPSIWNTAREHGARLLAG